MSRFSPVVWGSVLLMLVILAFTLYRFSRSRVA